MNDPSPAHPLPWGRVWIWGAALALVFFLGTHDPLASLQWRQTLPEEVRALVQAVAEGRMERRFAFPLLAILGFVGIARPAHLRVSPDLLLAGALALFVGWEIASVAWAEQPLLTGKRLLVLGMLVVGAVGLVRQWTLAGILAVTAACAAIHLAVGVIAEVWLDTFTPFQPGYRFAGTLHPNQQGINCALLAFGAFSLARGTGSPGSRSLALAGGWTSMVFLLLTRSRTAAAAALAGLLLMYVLGGTSRRRAVAGAAGASVLALLLLLQANGVLGASPETFLLGRQDSNFSTLSGRTDIWSYALRHALERPILGHGYNGFWSPRHTAEVSAAVDWKISEGHSAYVDTLLNLGVVGLMLFAALLGIGLMAALRDFRLNGDGATAAAAGLLLFGALDAVLESAMVLPNLLSFITLAVLAGLALRARPEVRPEVVPGRGHGQAVERPSDRLRPAGVIA